MRVARGRGAAHALRKDDGSERSFTTAGALREVVPPPYRLGVSSPDPCRLFADKGARLAVVFIYRESQTTCSDVVSGGARPPPVHHHGVNGWQVPHSPFSERKPRCSSTQCVSTSSGVTSTSSSVTLCGTSRCTSASESVVSMSLELLVPVLVTQNLVDLC